MDIFTSILTFLGGLLLSSVAVTIWFSKDYAKVQAVWFAFFGILCFLVVGLIQAIDYAKKVDARKESATQMPSAVEVANSRAYITMNFRHAPMTNQATGQFDAWGVTPRFINSGKTPTRNAKMRWNLLTSFGEAALPPSWDFPDIVPKADSQPHYLGTIPAGDERVGTPPTILSNSNLVAATQDKVGIFIWGWIEYNDIFASTPLRVHRFAVRIIPRGDPSKASGMTFHYQNLPTYNCSDEECERMGYPPGWKPRQVTQLGPLTENVPSKSDEKEN